MDSTKQLLDTRNDTHGSFIVNSRVGQKLKEVVRAEDSYQNLHLVHREALDFIFSKIGRIMAGQAEFADHWDDIAGYAKLPEKFNHGHEQSRLADSSPIPNSSTPISSTPDGVCDLQTNET